ncbi:hypothetical protein E3N88_33597 [Mikania micrantha]|uniref:Uncharacterized protein n=1 Tax=Mikania micrantha TaxID=192012 RepID=A0A5N6MCD8_9ASTR|nr:hypothetical protein E3N88_33597 [Mikania micrantha]
MGHRGTRHQHRYYTRYDIQSTLLPSGADQENECPVEREQIQEQRKKNSGFSTPRATRGPQETLSRYATGGNDGNTPHLLMPVDPTILSGSGTRRATRRAWRYMSRYATGLETQKFKFMIWKTAEGAFIRFWTIREDLGGD